MRWRIWVAVLLLAAVLTGGLVTRRRTEELCREMGSLLVSGEFERSYALWQECTPFFSALVTHDRVDAVSQSYARADAFFRAGTGDEYRSEMQNTLLQLSLLMDYDRLTVRSIL